MRSAVAAQSHQAVPFTAPYCYRTSLTRNSLASPSRSKQIQCRREFSHTALRRSNLPSNPQTHYDFFPTTFPNGPPPAGAFSIDLRELRNEFLKLQASAHPDRHAGDRKPAAEALSSRINEAYKTLQSPLLRAQYLLSLRGDESTTNDAAKLGDDSEDQDLLMEVLELREQIEEAGSEDDILEMKQENELRMAESIKVLADAFESDHLVDAAKEAIRLRYWVNVQDTLHAWEEGKPAPNLQH